MAISNAGAFWIIKSLVSNRVFRLFFEESFVDKTISRKKPVESLHELYGFLDSFMILIH